MIGRCQPTHDATWTMVVVVVCFGVRSGHNLITLYQYVLFCSVFGFVHARLASGCNLRRLNQISNAIANRIPLIGDDGGNVYIAQLLFESLHCCIRFTVHHNVDVSVKWA